jgi:hypothetical protein
MIYQNYPKHVCGLSGILRQLLPEGASGDSGLLTKGRVETSICRPGELEILHS